jgi:hypothetical protein
VIRADPVNGNPTPAPAFKANEAVIANDADVAVPLNDPLKEPVKLPIVALLIVLPKPSWIAPPSICNNRKYEALMGCPVKLAIEIFYYKYMLI